MNEENGLRKAQNKQVPRWHNSQMLDMETKPANFSLSITPHSLRCASLPVCLWKVCTALLLCRDRNLGLESYRCCWVLLGSLYNRNITGAIVSDTDHGKKVKQFLITWHFFPLLSQRAVLLFHLHFKNAPWEMPVKMNEERERWVYSGRLCRSNVKQRRIVAHIKEKIFFFLL